MAVDAGEGEPTDVAVRVPAGSTCAALAAALASALRLGVAPADERWVLYSHRIEGWLHDPDEVATAGLQNGDALSVTTAPGVEAAAPVNSGPSVVRVKFTAGPQVGHEVSLPAGEHLVGRAAGATIHVDDPFAAAEHARLSVAGDRLVLIDLGSTGGTSVDGVALSGSRALRAGQQVTIGGSTLVVTLVGPRPDQPRSTTGDVTFNRPPRVLQPTKGTSHVLPPPPSEPRRARLPLAAALLPLLLGGVMYAFIRSPLTLVFLAISPLMAIGSYVEGRMTGRGDYRRAREEFEERLEALRRDLEGATVEEARHRHEAAPTLRTVAVSAHRRDPWLWERRPQDDDFLELRVGLATLPSAHLVEFADGGSKVLREAAQKTLQPFAQLADVPLTLHLAELGAVGLAGPRESVLDMARWLVAQAATLQSPRNLSICAALPREEAAEWDWLKWLPHTGPQSAQFEGPRLCADNATARDLVERLVVLLDARATSVGPFRGTGARAPYPYVLALLHEDLPLSRATLTRLLAEGPRVGIVIAWLGSSARDLPNECQAVIEVDRERRVRLTLPSVGSVTSGSGATDAASAAEARQVALELAPLRDASAGDARGQLPRRVGLLELLGLSEQPSAAEIAGRWSDDDGALAAPLGVAAAGPFAIDLRGDGPHGLIGGTTGAGKSELLQTLVGALAASQPPRRLNFLLVDYKGGSAFKDAVNLPHTVGLVTDLDDHLAKRALISLRAELRRRERMLRDSGARDIVELERRGDGLAPPSLVIIVDEFATLAREVPEFVDGVVDLAQRGRSLGLHLLLATQRPAGVINDNIRANTNLRISLRMSDEADSVDVIGVPDAARIPRSWPGRAFARTGHQELSELQVAYAGASSGSAVESGGEGIEVVPLRLADPAFRPRAELTAEHDRDTDLRRLVTAIAAAHEGLGGVPAPRPWLPELPGMLAAESLATIRKPAGTAVALGLLDQPERQAQSPWLVDLATDGNLLVFGTSGSGKTSLLRTLAYGLAVGSDPAELQMYALDCAGGGLAAVSPLPHCGAYIRGDETERVGRLVQWLRTLVDSRRAVAAEDPGGTLARPGQARVVVLLDNYAGFVAAMEKIDFGEHVDAVPRLVADGPTVGVHFVITADRRAGVPSELSALVALRLVLRMADEDEYRNAGIAPEAFAGARLPPGRGFVDKGTEVQCAIMGESGSADEQAMVLRKTADAARARFGSVLVPAIQLLPARVEREQLPAASRPWTAVIGLEDAGLGAAELDLQEDGQLVVGPPRSGRSSALLMTVESLRSSTPDLRAVLLAPRKSPLIDAGPWAEVARGMAQCEKLAARLADEVRASESEAAGPTLLVVVDDGEEVIEGAVSANLEVVARRGRDHGYRICGAVETRAAHRAYGGWVAELRKGRRGLLLQPDVDIDGDLFGVRLARRANRAFPPGRGFLVQRGTAELVQVAVPAAT